MSTSKRNKEHLLIEAIIEGITIVEEYYNLMQVFDMEEREKDGWTDKIDSPTLEKIQSLSSQVIGIYHRFEPELGLGYDGEQLSFMEMMDVSEDDVDTFLERLRKLIWRLKALKDRKVQILPPEEVVRLKLVKDGSMAYWDNTLLPTIKGKHFDMLRSLAERPGEIIVHANLYKLVESEEHEDELIRQYISDIRKTFPTPYNDPSHPQCIIKTKRMEGYYLNLSTDLVKIV